MAHILSADQMNSDIEAAVANVRSLLQGDGYDVEFVAHTERELRLDIIATDAACTECLVPKNMLAKMISSTLPAHLADTEVVLTYPTDTAG